MKIFHVSADFFFLFSLKKNQRLFFVKNTEKKKKKHPRKIIVNKNIPTNEFQDVALEVVLISGCHRFTQAIVANAM